MDDIDDYKYLKDFLKEFDIGNEYYSYDDFVEDEIINGLKFNGDKFTKQCLEGNLEKDVMEDFYYRLSVLYECGERSYMKFILKENYGEITKETLINIKEYYEYDGHIKALYPTIKEFIESKECWIVVIGFGKYYFIKLCIGC